MTLLAAACLGILAALQVPGPEQALTSRLPGIAVEVRLAEAHSIAVGDTLELRSDQGNRRAFVVEAVYRARPDPATVLRGEYQARFHLSDLAALLGRPDRVDRIGVALMPGIDPDTAAARLNRVAFGYRAYPSDSIASRSSSTFVVVSRFHRAIALISIVASAIFLLCIMLLKIDERRLDTAVMRLIGLSRRTVFLAVVVEACLIAAVGSVLGVGLAAAASALTNAFYQRRFETALVFAHLSGDIVARGVTLALVLGVVAGVLAAARLVRTAPLTLWRRHP
ncbi:MAG: ABC transporter permease [Gemmatimonadales bacterium]